MSCGCNECREIELLTGQPGQQGIPGNDGMFGGNSDLFRFLGYSLSGNPGSGKLSFSGGNFSGTTHIYVSTTDLSSANVSTWLNIIGLSNSPTQAFIRVSEKFDSTKFVIFQVFQVISNSGYVDIVVNPISYSSAGFTANDELVFSYVVSGNSGSNGTNARTTIFNNLTAPNSGDTLGVPTNILTESIPANTFLQDGDSVHVQICLSTTETLFRPTTYAQFLIDGVSFSQCLFTNSSQSFIVDITIDRVDSTTYLASYNINGSQGFSVFNTYSFTSTGFDFVNNPIPIDIIALTNTANNGGIVCNKLFAEYKPI